MPSVSAPRKQRRRKFLIQKPRGQLVSRVQVVGPEHFGIVSVDCAKARSKFILADFYGNVHIPPTQVEHTRGHLEAALDVVALALSAHHLRDFVVAIERTGEYHRVVQRAVRARGWEARLVHSYASHQFRLPADPGVKTDDRDLAGIHCATVNGFGLVEQPLPADYQELQLLIRHRRDLVHKNTLLCCQIREWLHAVMPGYAECFSDLWTSSAALTVARHTGSARAVQDAGLAGLADMLHGRHCRRQTLSKILAWADTAPAEHPQSACLRSVITALDEDRLRKTQEIQALERSCAHLLVRFPYVLLLAIPGINIVSTADLAGELGPPEHYANANQITGRAGLMPTRYQSDQVDHADGPLRRCANRRLRAVLMQIADNLVVSNHHFAARAALWRQLGKDARWIRVKVAKNFSRIAFALLRSGRLFPHRCMQPRHYILDKLLAFYREHDTPMPEVLADLQAATAQLQGRACADEAAPLAQRLESLQRSRPRGPEPLGNILAIVLARLASRQVQSEAEDRDPG